MLREDYIHAKDEIQVRLLAPALYAGVVQGQHT